MAIYAPSSEKNHGLIGACGTKVMAQAVSFSDSNPVIGRVSGNVLVTGVTVSGVFLAVG